MWNFGRPPPAFIKGTAAKNNIAPKCKIFFTSHHHDVRYNTLCIYYVNYSLYLSFCNWVSSSRDFQRDQKSQQFQVYCFWNSWHLLFSTKTRESLILIMINCQIIELQSPKNGPQLHSWWYGIFMTLVPHSKPHFKLFSTTLLILTTCYISNEQMKFHIDQSSFCKIMAAKVWPKMSTFLTFGSYP